MSDASFPKRSFFATENPRERALLEALNAMLPHMLDMVDAPGMNIAIARRGSVIFEGAYGYADAAKKKPMEFDTVFHSGSMGKTYTGAAIMQLAEKGRLSLDDLINDHLPFDVLNPLGGAAITIRHLMTHSAGLGPGAGGSVFGDTEPLEQYLEKALQRETQPILGGFPTWTYRTGEDRYYSNLGMSILGLIVQRANAQGLSYSDYMDQHLLGPLGMTSTQYPPAQAQKYVRPDIWSRMSKGYNTTGDVWLETAPVVMAEYPAGGFLSIPRDHIRLLMAMMSGGALDGVRILDEQSVNQMLTPTGKSPHPGYGDNYKLGLIWFLKDWDKPRSRAFHHGGGHMFGWRTQSIVWPEYDTAVVYAFNEWSATLQKDYYALVDTVIETLLKSELPKKPAPTHPKIERLAWKASYLRGLLFVEAYRFGLGVPEQLDVAIAERIACEAQEVGGSSGDSLPWDPLGFVEGVNDMNAVEASAAAIHAFAQTEAMRITMDEALQIAPWFGQTDCEGRLIGTFATLAGLLTGAADGKLGGRVK